MEFAIMCFKIFGVVFAVVSGACLPVAIGMVLEAWLEKGKK